MIFRMSKLQCLLAMSFVLAHASPPLLMQVEWVLQGYDFSFTGFMCEFLGIARALRDELPMIILQRSSFRTGISKEHGSELMPNFTKDLFPAEEESLRYLTQRNISQLPSLRSAVPRSRFMPEVTATMSTCSEEMIQRDTYYQGGDMTRYQINSVTAESCCVSCLEHPLCLVWSYDSLKTECHLKSSMPVNIIQGTSTGFSSGAIRGATSTQQSALRVPSPRAIIFHGTTCIHKNESLVGSIHHSKRDINTILIGRYMVERSSFAGGLDLNEYAVLSCSSVVDEIWVPTQWHVEVMQNLLAFASVTGKRISVVPEAVDTSLFDPALVSEGAKQAKSRRVSPCVILPSRSNQNVLDTSIDISGLGDDTSLVSQRIACPSGTKFEFLSIFKWERRKGWDVLLEAYWRTFSKSDDVRLRLRTYLPSFLGGDPNITVQLEKFAVSVMGVPLDELAEVVWERGQNASQRENSMSREEVRDLYYQADCFVLPTRGEGWGLPIAEAMAMALPVIVTNYSGPTAYATADNSYLLPVLAELDDQHYAIPNGEILQELMLQVVVDSVQRDAESDSTVAAMKGLRARETMQRLNGTYIAEVIKDRLRAEAEVRGWVF